MTFVVHALMGLLFTQTELKTSTISGKLSNRKRRVDQDDEPQTINLLNPKKVFVIQEFVRRYLMNSMNLDKLEAEITASDVSAIISKKIGEIKYSQTRKLNDLAKKRLRDTIEESNAMNTDQIQQTDHINGIMVAEESTHDITKITLEDTMITDYDIFKNGE